MIKRFILRGGLVLLMLAVMVASVLDTQEVRAAGGTTQLIIGSDLDNVNKIADAYNFLYGGELWTTTIANVIALVTCAGTFDNLYVETTGVPGNNPLAFTLMVNGVPSILVATVAPDGTTASDSSHSVAVSPGDYVCLRTSRPSGDIANFVQSRWSVNFTGNVAGESIFLTHLATNTVATGYGRVTGEVTKVTNTIYVPEVIPTDGVIKNLYMYLPYVPEAGETATVTLVKNSIDTALTLTVTQPATTGNNVANEVAVVAGDIVYLKITATNSTGIKNIASGLTLIATDTSKFVILGNSAVALNTGSVTYNQVSSPRSNLAWSGADTRLQGANHGFIFSDFYVSLNGSPSAGKSYTLDLRDTSSNTGLSVTIADAETTGNDTTHTYKTTSDYSRLSMMCTPSGTPSARYAGWGIVGEYDPVSIPTLTTSAATSVTYNSAVGNGNITDTGGENPATRGFCYSTVNNPPTIADSLTNEAGSFGAGAYTLNITGLEEDTVYYVRSYATNSAGTGYGTTVSFTTIIGYPISRVIPLAFIFVGVILLLALVFVDGINIKGLIYIVIIIYALTALLAGINFMVRNLL